MQLKIIFLFFILLSNFSIAQMRKLDELINIKDDAISLILEWKNLSKNEIHILENDSLKSRDALYNTQVSTGSTMGAIIFHTGGILINNGWIRIYGSGNEKLNRNLPEWNKGKTFKNFGDKPTYLIIADDAVGGFFLLNGGKLGSDLGIIYYLAPDSLEPESLDLSYTDFINFCFNENINDFYKDLRWKNWENDFKTLSPNEAFVFYPYLWSKEGSNINKVQKNKLSMDEVYNFRIQQF